MERKLVFIFILASACVGLALASKTPTPTPEPPGLAVKTVKWHSATEHGEIKTLTIDDDHERHADNPNVHQIISTWQLVRSNKNPDTQWRTGTIVEYYYKRKKNASQPWQAWVKEAMRTEFAGYNGHRATQMDLGYLTTVNGATVRILEVCDTSFEPNTKYRQVVHEFNRYRGPIEPLGGQLTLGERITTITNGEDPLGDGTWYSKFDEQSGWHKTDSFADKTDCKSHDFPFELVKKKQPLFYLYDEVR